MLKNVGRTNAKKLNVIIFGTGGLAKLVTKAIPGNVSVLCYADNNTSMHGKFYMGKKVIPPAELHNYSFDNLIIASQFYKEIEEGLANDAKVPEHKIAYFNKYVNLGESKAIKERVTSYFFEFISGFENRSALKLANHYFREEGQAVKKVRWLDEQADNVVQTLDESLSFASIGPKFVAGKQKAFTVAAPAIKLYRFNDVEVDTASRTIIQDDQLIIERGLSQGFEQGDFTGGRLIKYGNKLSIIKSYEQQVIDKAIVINAVSDTNYYHSIIEAYAQLFYLERLDERFADYPIAIPEKTLSIASLKECLNSLNIDRDIVPLDSNRSPFIKDLLLITTPNNNLAINLKFGQCDVWQNYHRKESIDFIRNRSIAKLRDCQNTFSDGNDSFEGAERIYIGRKGPIRSFNQHEVKNLLKVFGFKCYYTEELTFMQQVSLFQNAKYIVGPTGAAWTNLIFTNRGTKALCWQATNLGDFSCFSNLANAYGVDLEYLVYKTKGISTRELFWEPYEISLREIKDWLITQVKD